MLSVELNLHQLITFYFVAKEKSFSTAALKMCLTQSAVTQQIKVLEKHSGVKLLHVKKKRVSLTEAGDALFSVAEEIYKHAKNAEQLLDNIKLGSSFRVGASTSFSGMIAIATAEFGNLFPDIRMSMGYGPSYRIVEQFLDLQYDVAVVASMNYQSPGLKAIRIADAQKLVLVVGAHSPNAESNQLTPADICGYPFLVPPEGSATRGILLERLKAEGLELKHPILVETDYLECIRRFAETGGVFALVPEITVREQLIGGKLKIIPFISELSVGIDLLLPTDTPPHPMADTFAQLTKKVFQKKQ